MYNLHLLRENPEIIKEELKKRQLKLDFDQILKLDRKRRKLEESLSQARHQLNQASALHRRPGQKEREKLKNLKQDIKEKEKEKKKVNQKFKELLSWLPNISHPSVPPGQDERDNQVIKRWGKPRQFKFKIKPHWEIAQRLNLVDFKQAARISGTRFWYFKGDLVKMQLALLNFVFAKLLKKGFIPIIPPVLVRQEAMFGTGFFPTETNEYYKITHSEKERRDALYLVGTAEVPLASLHLGQILKEKELPLKYAGYSTCFRREAGSYGKDVKGFFRGHQFDKIEMFVFCKEEESWRIHQELITLAEEIYQDLKLPYQIVNICSGDLGQPNAKKLDLEAWFPFQNRYRELVSCSNDTDFQARRLNIKYQTKAGTKKFVHTLNSTACAMARPMACIIENYQEKDGSIYVPQVLQKWMQKDRIT